jgi:hypothetical protein
MLAQRRIMDVPNWRIYTYFDAGRHFDLIAVGISQM